MSKKKHLIIGCGPAALSALETIRLLDQHSEIKVVSREHSLPYSPALLPYVISGRTTEEGLFPKDGEYFKKLGVDFVTGKEAVRILPEKRQVVYKDGDADQYESLLIACGAEPVRQAIQESEESDFLEFHTVSDLRRLTAALKNGATATILGAGMVAVELAVALLERGSSVRIIGRGRPLRAYFNEEAGGYIREMLTDGGIDIKTGKSISQVLRQAEGFEIRCAGGETFKTGLVISCLGVSPRLSLVKESGISADHGILVDSKMRTNLDGVYAAGDAVEARSFRSGVPGVCAILPEAIAQGKVAGANMAGKECDYEGWVPVNLLKLFGQSAFSAGAAVPEGSDTAVLERMDSQSRQFQRLVFENGRLVGATFVNVEIDPGVFMYLIKKRVNVGSHKQALLEQPLEVSRWLMLGAERGASS